MSKNASQAINAQPINSQVDPWPVIVRQMSSSKKSGAFQSSIPPPPPPPASSSPLNSQTFWLSFAAVLLGGGAYLIYTLNGEEQTGIVNGIKPTQSKKRKY